MPFPHPGDPGYRETQRRQAREVTRAELDAMAGRYDHPPRWVSQMVESGYLPEPRLDSKGKARLFGWLYPAGTDVALRGLCRLHKLGYRAGALRFAWFYLGRARWTPEAANYVANVLKLETKERKRSAKAQMDNPAAQNAMATDKWGDETLDDFTWADCVRQFTRDRIQGNTLTDRLKRLIIARNLGLRVWEATEKPRSLLGALAEEHAEAFGDIAESDELYEYAKALLNTNGEASPIPPTFYEMAPRAQARAWFHARMYSIRPVYAPTLFDPNQLRNFLERSQIKAQFVVDDAVINGNLIENAEQIIRDAAPNLASNARDNARVPDRQRARRKRVRGITAWLTQFSERERGRQGVPAPGPALAERAKDVASLILGAVAPNFRGKKM